MDDARNVRQPPRANRREALLLYFVDVPGDRLDEHRPSTMPQPRFAGRFTGYSKDIPRRADAMVTTTHDPAMGGHPRLLVAQGGTVLIDPESINPAQSPPQTEFALLRGVTSIGSSAASDISLPDVDPEQAQIIWDQFDEYVFVQRSPTLDSRINGELMGSHPLRTGDRIEMGRWTLTYARDEYADHGRPHGGRQGGEGEVQQEQPPRSALTPALEPHASDLVTQSADGDAVREADRDHA